MASPSRSLRTLTFIGTVLAAVVAAALIAPWYAKKRLIEEAHARGITLVVDDVDVGLGRARAKNVVATFDAVPGMKLTIPNVTMDLDGLTPKTLELHAPVLDADGPMADARAAFAKAPAPSSQLRVDVDGGIVNWRHAYGDATVDARDLKGHTVLGAADDDLTAEVSISLRTLTFGTYKTSFKRTGTTMTTRVGAPAGGPAFVEITLGDGTRDLTINVPKSKASDLGIPSAALGLVAEDGTMGELHLDHHEKAGATEGHVTVSADRLYLGHTPNPTSFSLDARYAGKGDKWPITGGSIQAGPFKGDVTGSLERTPATILVHLDSTTAAMSCAEAVKSVAAQTAGSTLATAAGAFAEIFGMDKAVQGDVKIHAIIDADLANLGKTSVSIHSQGACVLSFIPSEPAP